MRPVRLFVLAAVATTVVQIFGGITPASAVTSLEKVVLCKANEDPCLNGHFPEHTQLKANSTGVGVEILGAVFNVSCFSSTMTGETLELLAHGKIATLTFATCERTDNEAVCPVTSVNTPYLFKGELRATDIGYEVLVTNGGGGQPTIKVECGAQCKYGAGTVLFETEIVAGVSYLVVLQTLTGEGFCNLMNAVWHAKYEVKCLNGMTWENCYFRMEN